MTEHRAAVVEAIRSAKSILVTSHEHMDGDSIGASLGLMLACAKLGKTVYYQRPDEIPPLYNFVPNLDLLNRPVPEMEFDLGLIVDTSYIERVGLARERFAKLRGVVIDHHEGPASYGFARWNDTSAAAASILVAELIEELGVELDLAMALPLYVGIFTDTWSFQQTNTNGRAMRWGAKFIDIGVDPFFVTTSFFETRTHASVRLMGMAMERSRIERGVLWSYLLESDFAATGAVESDTEGIITALRTVGNVRVAVVFRELGAGKVKANFRAKDDTDVSVVARHFGGGGHKPAAGCTIQGTIDEVRTKVMERLLEEIEA